MTNEQKNVTESAVPKSATKQGKPRKLAAAKPVGGAMSEPPQLRRVDPSEPEPADRQLRQSAGLRSSRNPNSPLGQRDEKGATAPSQGGSQGSPKETKTAIALKALRRKRGASIVELQQVTGWQPHSVRGFLSGSVKKKLGLHVVSEVGKDGVRRYRVDDAGQAVPDGSAGQGG